MVASEASRESSEASREPSRNELLERVELSERKLKNLKGLKLKTYVFNFLHFNNSIV